MFSLVHAHLLFWNLQLQDIQWANEQAKPIS